MAKTNFDDFTYQFRLSPDEPVRSPNWRVRELGDWTLSTHESLPVIDVHDIEGERLGWYLGFPISPEGRIVTSATKMDVRQRELVADEFIEDIVYDFGGRWIFIWNDGGPSRVYLDPCGTLAAVFDVDRPRVASTMLLLDPDARFGREWLGLASKFPATNQFYPAGLTGSAACRRLMPNHYLDLSRRVALRHWPDKPIQRVSGEMETTQLVQGIVHHVSRNMSAIAERYEAYVSLTAGRDSRMLLACGRHASARISCFTFAIPDEMARVDMEVARVLCRRHGMTHVRVPIECVSDETRQRYLERVGYAGNSGKARDFLQAAERHLDVSKVWLIGYAGEVGRAFYWKPADRADIPSDPDDLLSRMNLPTNERFRRAMEGWIHGLSGMDLQTVLDFMYLEQRMGAWASAHMHGSAPGMNVMTPFCHRQVMQSMLRLPTAYTYRQRLASDVIAVAWPDLGRLPFQRRPGAIGYLRHFGRRHVVGTFRRSVDRLGDLRGKSVVYDQWYRSVRAVYRRVGKRGR